MLLSDNGQMYAHIDTLLSRGPQIKLGREFNLQNTFVFLSERLEERDYDNDGLTSLGTES